jgi:predicted  nucleic acid-binding Zn-ribbon protein
MEDLEDLDINFTDFDKGLEYLIKRINELKRKIELNDDKSKNLSQSFSESSLPSEGNLSGRIDKLKRKIEKLENKIKEKWEKFSQAKNNNDHTLVAKLKEELTKLKKQLALKEQEIDKLIKQCNDYLNLITKYYEKQKEAKEIGKRVKTEGYDSLEDELSSS